MALSLWRHNISMHNTIIQISIHSRRSCIQPESRIRPQGRWEWAIGGQHKTYLHTGLRAPAPAGAYPPWAHPGPLPPFHAMEPWPWPRHGVAVSLIARRHADSRGRRRRCSTWHGQPASGRRATDSELQRRRWSCSQRIGACAEFTRERNERRAVR
jgi:hypothetical protein